ncbi:MAG: hypothetical protein ACREIG_01630, partial [Nitrospiraceae bacterium]
AYPNRISRTSALAHMIHESSAAARICGAAGSLAVQPFDVLLGTGALYFGACPSLRSRGTGTAADGLSQSPGLRVPVPLRVFTLSRRTLMNNMG